MKDLDLQFNKAINAGAIYCISLYGVVLKDSTIEYNTVEKEAGGIFLRACPGI